LEVGVVASEGEALPVALDGGEDVVLGEADVSLEEGEHETEETLLCGDCLLLCHAVALCDQLPAGMTPRASTTYTRVRPDGSPLPSAGMTTSTCEPMGVPMRASMTAAGILLLSL